MSWLAARPWPHNSKLSHFRHLTLAFRAKFRCYDEQAGGEMPAFVKVARADDVPAGIGKLVEVAGKQVALFRVNDT